MFHNFSAKTDSVTITAANNDITRFILIYIVKLNNYTVDISLPLENPMAKVHIF
jgi:hypothetical protein